MNVSLSGPASPVDIATPLSAGTHVRGARKLCKPSADFVGARPNQPVCHPWATQIFRPHPRPLETTNL